MLKKIGFLLLLTTALTSCSDDGKETVLLFSPEKDVELGAQLKQEIFANPSQYPLLDSVQYRSAYEYIRGLKYSILNTGEIGYRDEFAWKVYIIEDDQTLNAFA